MLLSPFPCNQVKMLLFENGGTSTYTLWLQLLFPTVQNVFDTPDVNGDHFLNIYI